MKNLSLIILALGVSFFTVSCKKDKENPTITISTPAQHSFHKYKEEVHVNAIFTDDRGLKSYEVLVGDQDGTLDKMFDWQKKGAIEGTEYKFHDHFMIPENAMMMRWVHFTVTDEKDNVTTMKWMLHFEE